MAKNKLQEAQKDLNESLTQMQIDIDAALEYGEKITDRDRRLRFYGRRYLELIKLLKNAGLIE